MGEQVRGQVVAALVAAHRSPRPWAELAAVAFEFDPPPTEEERATARTELRRDGAADALSTEEL